MKHGTLAAWLSLLGRSQWTWLPAAIVLESASFAALAIMQRRLLASGGAAVGIRPMLLRRACDPVAVAIARFLAAAA